jgi:hypothetical protein
VKSIGFKQTVAAQINVILGYTYIPISLQFHFSQSKETLNFSNIVKSAVKDAGRTAI